jgi:hypothetical protein
VVKDCCCLNLCPSKCLWLGQDLNVWKLRWYYLHYLAKKARVRVKIL